MGAKGFSHDGEVSGGGVYMGVSGVMSDKVVPALTHNLRHLIPGHPTPMGADPSRTALNEVMHGARSVEEATRLMAEARARHRVVPPQRKDAWLLTPTEI